MKLHYSPVEDNTKDARVYRPGCLYASAGERLVWCFSDAGHNVLQRETSGAHRCKISPLMEESWGAPMLLCFLMISWPLLCTIKGLILHPCAADVFSFWNICAYLCRSGSFCCAYYSFELGGWAVCAVGVVWYPRLPVITQKMALISSDSNVANLIRALYTLKFIFVCFQSCHHHPRQPWSALLIQSLRMFMHNCSYPIPKQTIKQNIVLIQVH